MTFVPAIVLSLAQAAPLPKPTPSENVAAGKAIAAYELAPWRKLHPKADLALTFTNPAVAPAQANLVRQALGYKDPTPVLDSTVLTLVFGAAQRPAPKRISVEAYVFQGSFPKGFRALYLIGTDGKAPKVLSRTILDKYEIVPAKPNT